MAEFKGAALPLLSVPRVGGAALVAACFPLGHELQSCSLMKSSPMHQDLSVQVKIAVVCSFISVARVVKILNLNHEDTK